MWCVYMCPSAAPPPGPPLPHPLPQFCAVYVDRALQSLSQLPSCGASLLLRDILVSLPANTPPPLPGGLGEAGR